ncbi:MAG TPA: GGDEF domain-containing protein [Planctomycetota bacterium]|nr:GGDEF domain-containing protein [Planctomycetota bacterium]
MQTQQGASLDAGTALSVQLAALTQRALTGNPDDINRLARWSGLVEQEATLLRRRLRKQQHDFSTLFEIVGQTSARSLDVVAMQTYLLRTVSGHFATTRLLILRRMRAEDSVLTCSAAQGVRDANFSLPLESPLCEFALQKRGCFSLKEFGIASRHADDLRGFGVHTVVPLIQEVEGSGAVLEGLLLLGARLASQDYNEEDVDFLQVLGKMLAICLRNEALYRRSIIDDLTGVASRGHFDAQLSQELNRIMTYGHKSLGLVMLDVDEFKHFNDTYGHQTGDKVLQELSRLMVHQVRNVDLVARYGGEEFAIILLEIDRAKVMEVAQRLRKAVEDMEIISAQGQKLKITCSFGLACFPDDATERSTLIQLADEALYQSKAAGRNRVTMAEPGSGLNRAVVLGPRVSTVAPSAGPGIKPVAPPPMTERESKHSGIWMGVAASEYENLQRQRRELAGAPDKFETPFPDERRRTAIRTKEWLRSRQQNDKKE